MNEASEKPQAFPFQHPIGNGRRYKSSMVVNPILSAALNAIGIELRPGSAHAAFRSSIFGTWTETTLSVEFMADFYRRLGEAWLPVRPATRQPIVVEGVAVFVPDDKRDSASKQPRPPSRTP